jgi:FkbM family methyltransferase
LLYIFSNPLPLLGFRLKDSFKLACYVVFAFLALPLLFLRGESYSRFNAIINKAAPKGITIKTGYGMFYCRNYDDFFVLWPAFEDELKGVFTCDNQQVFIDVGAHVGRYTVMVGSYAKRVVSIEPNSENFRALKLNIMLNGLGNVNLLNRACWDKTGLKLDLFLSSSPGKHSFLHTQTYSEKVDTITLDRILEELMIAPSEVGLVKIDAEGAESQILRGGEKLFSEGRPRVIFEAFPQNVKIAKEALRSCGYQRITLVGENNYIAEKVNGKVSYSGPINLR